MQSLYSNGFEKIYDEMYQVFIDYKDEFQYYSNIIQSYNKQSVIEIGCGSGNLAKHFINSEIAYTGLDLSADMVQLSQQRNPKGEFYQGDMTNFSLKNKTEATIITGRSTSYLLNNKAVHNALQSIYNNLEENGILCFDFIDANRFFSIIKGGKEILHEAPINGKEYYRKSFMKPLQELENFMFQWDAVYFEKTETDTKELTKDESVVRAFTKNEWELFLDQNNFKVLEIIDRKSYAFDTYVVVAQKQ